MAKYGLVEPYKSNAINQRVLFGAIRRFLVKSKDDESVYRQILNSGKFDEEEVFCDMLALLFAGFDTTSHGLSSMLYLLKKHPHTMKKLRDALDHDGILTVDLSQGASLKELYEK